VNGAWIEYKVGKHGENGKFQSYGGNCSVNTRDAVLGNSAKVADEMFGLNCLSTKDQSRVGISRALRVYMRNCTR
jgi:hypothetical protein